MSGSRHDGGSPGPAGRPDRREPVVRVVDDDPALLRAVAMLLGNAGFRVETFESAAAFLARRGDAPGCALLDLHMPGAGGLEVQHAVLEGDDPLPLIFLSGRGDVRTSVRAMKSGAVDFLTKPVPAGELLEAVRRAVDLDRAARVERHASRELSDRYQSLTPRERQVFALVSRGLLNKQIAAELGTTERTVKAHRANVIRKMGVDSVAALARAADRLQTAMSGAVPLRPDPARRRRRREG